MSTVPQTSARTASKEAVPPSLKKRSSTVRLISNLTYYADEQWICNRSYEQNHRDTGLNRNNLGEIVKRAELWGAIEVLTEQNNAFCCRVLKPVGPRRIEVTSEVDARIDSIRVWTKKYKLSNSENAALRAIAIKNPLSNEELAEMIGLQTTRRVEDEAKRSPGARRAVAEALRKLGRRRFDRTQRGGARVQLGGGYSIQKNAYRFGSLESDPDRLKTSFVSLFTESPSASNEREKLLNEIRRHTPDKEGWRWIFIRALEDGTNLDKEGQVQTRLRQMVRLGWIDLKAAERNKTDGPFGPKGQRGPIGIFVKPRNSFAQFLKDAMRTCKLALKQAGREGPSRNTWRSALEGITIREQQRSEMIETLRSHGLTFSAADIPNL